MMNKDVFKAYDIRGVYPDDVNKELVRDVAGVLSDKFFGNGSVIIGRDVRAGSEEMYREAIEALKGGGHEIIGAGVITTPMLTFLVNDLSAAGGIMITASHNPKEYNGIKMLGEKGASISGEDIKEALGV